ncbi:hypothetical protein WME89_17605 [Sorangium sp. So ce321]|uniref:hypothetical protein n=1 Tax=Sorangium sp. So ce321 TaxID=3133300 RepID=UPI003F604BFC
MFYNDLPARSQTLRCLGLEARKRPKVALLLEGHGASSAPSISVRQLHGNEHRDTSSAAGLQGRGRLSLAERALSRHRADLVASDPPPSPRSLEEEGVPAAAPLAVTGALPPASDARGAREQLTRAMVDTRKRAQNFAPGARRSRDPQASQALAWRVVRRSRGLCVH